MILTKLRQPRRRRLRMRKIAGEHDRNNHENTMRKEDLAAMQFEELWLLHERLTKILSDKIVAEKRSLEDRLAKLNRVEITTGPEGTRSLSIPDRAPRRKYPKVLPKYCNPQAPSETWSGRGKRPRWLVAALETGHRLDEFEISNVEEEARKNRANGSRRT
jgi:DNA-binding protein H-NS